MIDCYSISRNKLEFGYSIVLSSQPELFQHLIFKLFIGSMEYRDTREEELQ